MEVQRYFKRTSSCSDYISGYIAVDNELQTAVGDTQLDVTCDFVEFEGMNNVP